MFGIKPSELVKMIIAVIVILMLLALGLSTIDCQAQEPDSITVFLKSGEWFYVYPTTLDTLHLIKLAPADSAKPVIVTPQWLIELNLLWNEYKEFCKTDTTAEYRKAISKNNNTIEQLWYIKHVYIVTTTPTFEGFMEWLR